MNVAVARAILGSPLHRALFGAAVLIANERGATVAELSRQLGVSKSAIRRYTQAARERRERSPRAHLVYSALIEQGCDHTHLWGPGLRVCLDCLATNMPDHPALRRRKLSEPRPEPSKVYRPGLLKGGVG